jgi:hypothetical protein
VEILEADIAVPGAKLVGGTYLVRKVKRHQLRHAGAERRSPPCAGVAVGDLKRDRAGG